MVLILVNPRARAVVSLAQRGHYYVPEGLLKYHRSRWTQSLACLGYGQYTDMFTCISTYLVQISDNTVFSCTNVYTEATRSAVKKIVGSLLKNEGDY